MPFNPSLATEVLKPQVISDDIDGKSHVAMYGGNIWAVLRTLSIDTSFERQVSIKRKGEKLICSQRFNCGHDHDCCGCVYAIHWEITKLGGYWVVIRSSSRNV